MATTTARTFCGSTTRNRTRPDVLLPAAALAAGPASALVVGICAALFTATAGAARITDPHLPDKTPERISEHVYMIQGWPDVEFVVGSQATLVVDTGLGPRNGAIAAAQAQKLAKGGKLYLVTTHHHPEHSSGDGGFPKDTVLLRSHVQQDELAADGDRMLTQFRGQAQNKEFLPDGLTFRKPDILFDKTYTLDLGGVHARIDLIGPAHTKGDQIVWVVEDRTLISGDLAINGEAPRRMAEGVDAKAWVAVLDRLADLKPLHVIPDHAEPGDASLISAQRELLLKQ